MGNTLSLPNNNKKYAIHEFIKDKARNTIRFLNFFLLLKINTKILKENIINQEFHTFLQKKK